MIGDFPRCVLGTTRIDSTNQASLGSFLDAAGQGTLLTDGGSLVWEALRIGDRLRRWQVWAMVPNVAGYVREATDFGMFGAGWRRLRRMNPLSCGRLFLQGLLNVRGVLRRDFPTLLRLLLELEMANFRRARPPVVFLHPQITDLLLAMDHGQALQQTLTQIRKGFGAEPGLATNNLGTLLPRLYAWGIDVPCVLTSLHPQSYGMRPSRQACEDCLRHFEGRIVATLETPLNASVAAYWRSQEVSSSVYDVAEPNLTQWHDWQTGSCPKEAQQSRGKSAEQEVLTMGAG